MIIINIVCFLFSKHESSSHIKERKEKESKNRDKDHKRRKNKRKKVIFLHLMLIQILVPNERSVTNQLLCFFVAFKKIF